MALTLNVTDAGRAAMRNPQGDGTNAVRIATVGVTATAFVSGGPLPAEIKRLATIAGGATAPDTIHVTISDTGTDVYSVRGYGFYLADGTLFASYGQADVIVEKSAQATMMLAVDVKFTAIDATQITFGDSNFSNAAATTDTLGVVRLASDAEAIAGADAQKALTAKSLLAALNDRLGAGAPSAFVKTLLTKASVLAFCTALGIRGAAQYDTGSGNGLDADLLDGKDGAYYLQWANLAGVPSVFAPAPHTHSANDITSGTLPVVRGGTGLSTAAAGSYLIGNGTGAFQLKAPADVLTDIGAAAKQHSHPISDINGLQGALDAKTTPAAVATQITAAINGVINSAPGALDTLKELADAMGDDPNFAATVTNAIAGKVAKTGDTMSGKLNTPAGLGTLYINPPDGSTQGFNFVWNNISPGQGRVEYVNSHGGGSGGHYWYERANTSDGVNNTMSLDNAGNLYSSATMSCSYLISRGGVVQSGSSAGMYRQWSFNGTMTSSAVVNPFSASSTFVLSLSGSFGGGLRLVDGSYDIGLYSVNGALQFGFGQGGGAQSAQASISSGGAIVANGGYQVGSDRRLKKGIKRRSVQRGLALKIAKIFSEWTLKSNGMRDVGVIAQTLERIAPHYVRDGIKTGRMKKAYLSIDKAGLALEASMDNALAIEEIRALNAQLLKRITKLEACK